MFQSGTPRNEMFHESSYSIDDDLKRHMGTMELCNAAGFGRT